MKTIEQFTAPEDRNIFSYVMEKHQKNAGANGKILQYMSQMYLYPESLELLVYVSQLLQAEAIRYGWNISGGTGEGVWAVSTGS